MLDKNGTDAVVQSVEEVRRCRSPHRKIMHKSIIGAPSCISRGLFSSVKKVNVTFPIPENPFRQELQTPVCKRLSCFYLYLLLRVNNPLIEQRDETGYSKGFMYNLRVPGEQELNEGLGEVKKRGEGCRSVDRLAPACHG
ncbi:hypothetical protein ACP275_02G117700 [Erythranthe tilingii]